MAYQPYPQNRQQTQAYPQQQQQLYGQPQFPQAPPQMHLQQQPQGHQQQPRVVYPYSPQELQQMYGSQMSQQQQFYQGHMPQQVWGQHPQHQQPMMYEMVQGQHHQIPQPVGPNPYQQPELLQQRETGEQAQVTPGGKVKKPKTEQQQRESMEKSEQHEMQQAYLKATIEEKKTGQFWKDLPIENMIDHEAIAYAREAGLTDPVFKTGKMSKALVNKMNYMKSKHRSSLPLRKWSIDGYWCRQNEVLKVQDPATFTDTIERVNINDLTVEEFIERYEKGSRPCIITGVTQSWQGMQEWQVKRLFERFGDSLFKIGESDSGRKLKVTLKEYIEYALFNRDDSPLYLFESNIEEHPQMRDIIDEYEVPQYLREDLFVELLGEKKAPPHRWFLIGPKRSGSEVHQDPLGTSAWNTSVCGHKRWVMMPPGPGITKSFVRGEHLLQKGEDDEAIQYFDKILPRLKRAEGPTGSNKLPIIIEGVQYPGETIFVPGNWWHGVQNLDLTIAITQNFVNRGNFEKVWLRTRKGRKKLSVRFLAKLKNHYPELYAKAIQMNQRDEFVMWDKREKYAHKFVKKAKKPAAEGEENKAEEESSNDTISSSSSSSSSSNSSSSGEDSSDDRDGNNIDASSSSSGNSSQRSRSAGGNSSDRRSYDPDSSDLDSKGSRKHQASRSMHQPEHGSSNVKVVNDGLGGANQNV